MLRVVIPQDPEQLDPRFVADTYGLRLSRLLFASLVRIDPQTLEAVPDLASSVRVVTPTRYVAHLRPDLRFSDGSTLDAADVVATYEGVVSAKLGSRYRSTYERIARVQALDAHTVQFDLREPHAPFMTDLELPIVRAEDAFVHIAGPGMPPPVGAGPYRLVSRAPGRLELATNPHWYAGVPLHPRVRFIVVRDDNTRALRLLARAADLAVSSIPPMLVPLFEAPDAGFDVRTAPGIGTTYIGFNTDAPAVHDARVRRAIAYAIDRALIVQTKLGGRAHLTSSWIPRDHWASAEDLPTYAFDPARAAALLDQAGLVDPDGPGPRPRARLVMRTGADRFRVSLARAMAAMLAWVGLEVDVRPSETATLLSDLNRGRFELCLLQMPEVIEPHVLSWFFASDRVPGPGREGANRWRYRNPVLDAAFERGAESTDRADRIAAYRTVQAILARDLPVLPLWQEDVVAVVRHGVPFTVPRDGRFDPLAR